MEHTISWILIGCALAIAALDVPRTIWSAL